MVKSCSAVFGDDMWAAGDIRRVRWAINNRMGDVRLVLERAEPVEGAAVGARWYCRGKVRDRCGGRGREARAAREGQSRADEVQWYCKGTNVCVTRLTRLPQPTLHRPASPPASATACSCPAPSSGRPPPRRRRARWTCRGRDACCRWETGRRRAGAGWELQKGQQGEDAREANQCRLGQYAWRLPRDAPVCSSTQMTFHRSGTGASPPPTRRAAAAVAARMAALARWRRELAEARAMPRLDLSNTSTRCGCATVVG